MKPETLAVHAGRNPGAESGAVVAPIHLSTTFVRGPDGRLTHGHNYARESNPTRAALETCLAALEGGSAAAAFASGSAAALAVFNAVAPAGRIVCSADVYHGIARQLVDIVARWGTRVIFVDAGDLDAVRAAMPSDTRLLWIETPSNPLLKIADIAALADIAHRAGARLACDNTFATPILQQPLALGADLVMHSTTKYIGGHSDVLGGAVVASEDDELFASIRHFQGTGGAAPGPFDCWLLQRSIATLPCRIRAQSAGALAVARYLVTRPEVERVLYPGLEDHPGHALAARQMGAFGGMASFCVRGGAAEALRVTAGVRLFTRATSLGGVESLIEHRASAEGSQTRTPQNLLRLSIGLEHADDLLADLGRALDAARLSRGSRPRDSSGTG
ncbi:MAG TPA: aminotransferase class I/II-fold pyridoxal phosphate-dependent enzyme [Gammaproteobacteria bacterium]|nr:aminotransferase class I/II-fold pyridoxal phosphate-dependent enzyme [Gammaproteobacteria bacterium]